MPSQILLENLTAHQVTIAAAMSSLVTTTTNNGAQSDKIDLTASRAQQMLLRVQTAWAVNPAAGAPLECYVAFSSASTAGSSNVAGLVGAVGNYAGYANNAADAKRQLTFVGVLSACATTANQTCDVGTFTPTDQWCQVVLINGATQALAATNVTTVHQVQIFPLVDEAQ